MKECRESSSVCSRAGSEEKATGLGIVRHSFCGDGVGFYQKQIKDTLTIFLPQYSRNQLLRR